MTPTAEQVQAMTERLRKEAVSRGYHLSPDVEAVRSLVEGLLVNIERYGYPSCPCRLSFGEKDEDLDIICPCDYRDPDLDDYGACYCSLYVSKAMADGIEEVVPVPERRPPRGERKKVSASFGRFPYPVHRCRVCGYLCAREKPPEKCPICMAGRDRFEQFA